MLWVTPNVCPNRDSKDNITNFRQQLSPTSSTGTKLHVHSVAICVLCFDLANDSIATSAAVGGGVHMHWSSLCPSINHWSGPIQLISPDPNQDSTQGIRPGFLSTALKLRDTNVMMDSPRITPSVKSPLDKALVPCPFILVPAQWITWSMNLSVIWSFCNLRMRLNRWATNEAPLQKDQLGRAVICEHEEFWIIKQTFLVHLFYSWHQVVQLAVIWWWFIVQFWPLPMSKVNSSSNDKRASKALPWCISKTVKSNCRTFRS